MNIAFNEPYVVEDYCDYSIPVHGEANGIPHVMLEIRNDQISDESGQKEWAHLLSEAISRLPDQIL